MSAVNRLLQVSAVLTLTILTSGCVTAVVGSAATVGVGAAEERGFEGAVDDTKIRTAINNLWFSEDLEVFRDITLTINEGRVMLTGSVKKPETRVEAVRLAWQAAGVRQVIDEIQVEDKSGFADYASDVWIANKLRTRLMFDSKIKNINYTTDVVNGVVYLMGIAQDQDELDRVIAYARDTSDVKRVVSHVVLKNDPHRQF
ncbi:BON domain-containing protein [Telmatospirillum sp.]|uniref:BON domain-containing protein n=1 Tax=Telmatospirillum sp. TaxID=2079197 RepID=UPI00284D4DE7|nr:BON domain-containing protein [Telmatospirillum sp.]MDR3439641.1 BON domain-containing protein [Telmatospirillum sp.]